MEQFALDCPAYVALREKYGTLLRGVCEEYEIGFIYDVWSSDDKSHRISLVLGDCSRYIVLCVKQRRIGRLLKLLAKSVSCQIIFNAICDGRKKYYIQA